MQDGCRRVAEQGRSLNPLKSQNLFATDGTTGRNNGGGDDDDDAYQYGNIRYRRVSLPPWRRPGTTERSNHLTDRWANARRVQVQEVQCWTSLPACGKTTTMIVTTNHGKEKAKTS